MDLCLSPLHFGGPYLAAYDTLRATGPGLESSADFTIEKGVLKLTFDGDDLECVDIHLKFENAQRWPFHIRDSLAFEPKGVTDTQDNVAEVTTWNKDISVYRRNSRGVWQLQANATNFLQGTVKMIVANNKFYASNGAKNFSVKRSHMYPINKAAADDSTFNLYLGLNRGAETDWRQGTGLCWVGLSWRDERCGSANWLKDLE
ncbi:hypothetical protein BaRGS_00038294 [Batillaria attramentaria]|uniref:Uncharacterized protein n=1 Tax=Batillaria attramentaria TaxID=370345 RepID=A0ABD0J795_9CAEN